MEKILFREEQKFRPNRVRFVLPVVFIVTVIIFAIGISKQIKHTIDSGNGISASSGSIVVGIFALLFFSFVMLIIFRMKLITWIDSQGIHVRYPPLRQKEILIVKESIRNYEVRKYRARHEYGGYGYRFRGKLIMRKKYGIALTASGDTGIQLELTGGEKILVGTHRETAFMYALDKIMKESS